MGVEDAVFHLGLVAGFTRTGGNHRHAVVGAEFGVDRIDFRVILAGGLDPGLQLIRHHNGRNAAKVFEGADMRHGPVGDLLTGDRHGKDPGTGSHGRNKQFGRNNFTGLTVNI